MNYLKHIIGIIGTIGKLLFSMFLFIACDPYYSSDYIIENKTEDTVLVLIHNPSGILDSSITTYPGTKYMLYNTGGHGGGGHGGPGLVLKDITDSITFRKEEKEITHLHSDNNVRNIFNQEQSWETANKKNHQSFIYYIENSDFENAIPIE